MVDGTDDIISAISNRLICERFSLDWYEGRKCLVTGGAGFIGSWLVEMLVQLGSDVYVIDNLWRGSLDNIKHTIDLDMNFILGDIRNYELIQDAIHNIRPDIIFHLADVVAGIDFVFDNEPFIFRSNILINSNLFSAVKEFIVPKLIYVGTACSYPQELQMEPSRPPLEEEQAYPANPESAYGWSKLMGEYEGDLICKHINTELGLLRLHNVYGPRSILHQKRSQVIPSLLRKAIRYPKEDFLVWGSGKQARDFIFVGDVIDALIRLPLKGMDKGVIQLGSGKETSIAELAHMIVKITGKDIPVNFDLSKPEGDGGRSGNYRKANNILDWKPHTKIEEGLMITYKWASHEINHKGIQLDN